MDKAHIKIEKKILYLCIYYILVLSLQELCCRAIVARTSVYSIEQLPLPTCVKSHLKSYAMTTSSMQLRYTHSQRNNKGTLGHRKLRFIIPSSGLSTPTSPGLDSANCTGRNSCCISWREWFCFHKQWTNIYMQITHFTIFIKKKKINTFFIFFYICM